MPLLEFVITNPSSLKPCVSVNDLLHFLEQNVILIKI